MRRPDPDRIRQAKDAGLEARLHGRPLPVTRPLAPNTTPELRRAMLDAHPLLRDAAEAWARR